MKQRPILFSAPMVRALLDGSKTQTRRVVKLPHSNPLGIWEPTTISGNTKTGEVIPEQAAIWHTRTGDCLTSPYGQPGDHLWVREAWRTIAQADNQPPRDMDAGYRVWYEADGLHQLGYGKPRPIMFMPRWASRITLEVTGVRVERLQDITEADAIAEGCTKNHNNYYWGGPHSVSGLKQFATATQAYRDLWVSINGPDSWDLTPWVWVIEFERISA